MKVALIILVLTLAAGAKVKKNRNSSVGLVNQGPCKSYKSLSCNQAADQNNVCYYLHYKVIGHSYYYYFCLCGDCYYGHNCEYRDTSSSKCYHGK